jgi:hypothetical protein
MKIRILFLSLIGLTIFSCDRVCKKTTQDHTPVQNLTGQDVDIKVCKSIYGDARLAIPAAATEVQNVDLGSRKSTTVRGGPDAVSCSGVENDQQNLRISLPEESFSTLKLCYNEESRTHALVEVSRLCPEGFKQQMAASDCAYYQ